MMYSDSLLIIFIKNPQLGKVKTRLAKTLGDQKALKIYQLLLDYTHKITKNLMVDKAVYYSDFIENSDKWKNDGYTQFLQRGDELGVKMENAFLKAFNMGYKKVVIIGSDCLELNETILLEAFKTLDENKATIGPANDGGYYLLGLTEFQSRLFHNKKWSSENVLLDTLLDLTNLNISFKLLPTLSDVDEENDLKNYPEYLEA